MSGFTPEILPCTTYTYFPELAAGDGQTTGRWHMYRLTPICPTEGRSARYDPIKDSIYQDIDEADKAYRRLQREALQVMVDQVDPNG